MITHVVLFRPRADLAEADRKTLLDAFMRLSCDIPSVQAARLGQRVTFGYGYESVPQPDYRFMLELDFANADGLKAYLTHPAHRELADRFYAAVDVAHAYDMTTALDTNSGPPSPEGPLPAESPS